MENDKLSTTTFSYQMNEYYEHVIETKTVIHNFIYHKTIRTFIILYGHEVSVRLPVEYSW